MRSAPKLSLNLSFTQPYPPAHAEPPLSLNINLGSSTSNGLPASTLRPLLSAVERTSPSVMSFFPGSRHSTSPRPTASSNNSAPSPTSLNTIHNQTLATWCPSPATTLGIKTTTLTYGPMPYGPPTNSPKSILKRRDSDSDSIASITPPHSGRSIRFLDEPVIHTITPVSPTAQWGDDQGSGYVRMTRENRWQRNYDSDGDDDHGGVD
jgi:hypothetical protein